ncbi:hypothetical protein IW142_003554 [Coemansia sp. RSA 564]|nr:hypothetical protein IW142_003554 [Coemansia sp. RSA 564]
MQVHSAILFIGMIVVGLSSAMPNAGVAAPESGKAVGANQQDQPRDLHARLIPVPAAKYPPALIGVDVSL